MRSLRFPSWWISKGHSEKTFKYIPKLYYKHTKDNIDLVECCPHLSKEFNPPSILRNTHVQSVMGVLLFSRPSIEYSRSFLKLSDGGEVIVDIDNHSNLSPNSPITIIFPGLTGNSYSGYVRHLVSSLRAHGLRSVVVNYRGYRYGHHLKVWNRMDLKYDHDR
jgi:predicted alpha/beta-fold hydrolase